MKGLVGGPLLVGGLGPGPPGPPLNPALVCSHYFFVLGRMLVVVLNPLCPVRLSLLL